MTSSLNKGIINYVLMFIGGLAIVYTLREIKNYFIAAAILALIALIFVLFYQKQNGKPLTISKKGLMRYTLLCHNCNWEWMSNVTSKKYVKKCPNCAETAKIEIMGIRRVHKLPKRSHKDLTSYFGK